MGKEYKDLTPEQQKVYDIVSGVLALLYVVFFVWALVRASRCSSISSDSKAIHYLFAIASPFMYVTLSYAAFDCKKK